MSCSDHSQCADPRQNGCPQRVPLWKHLELDQDHSFVSRLTGVRYAVGTCSKSVSSQAPAAQPWSWCEGRVRGFRGREGQMEGSGPRPWDFPACVAFRGQSVMLGDEGRDPPLSQTLRQWGLFIFIRSFKYWKKNKRMPGEVSVPWYRFPYVWRHSPHFLFSTKFPYASLNLPFGKFP